MRSKYDLKSMQSEGKSEVTSALDSLTKDIKLRPLRWFTKGVILIVLAINLILAFGFLLQQFNAISPWYEWLKWLTCPIWGVLIVLAVFILLDASIRWIFRSIFRIKS